MATQVFLGFDLATWHRGTNTAKLNTAASGWFPLRTQTTRGTGVTTIGASTVAGATNGVEVANGSIPVEWLTPPIDQDVTISGAITGNIWAAESNMSANVAINFKVDKVAATDGTITQIVKSARVTELAVTTPAVNNFTATPGAGVACAKGDRLRITIFGDDAGTMASGHTFSVSYFGTSAAADGDTYVSFTETFGFQTTDPTSIVSQLTDDSAGAIFGNTGTEEAYAQSFQVPSATTVSAVDLRLLKTGTPTDFVVVTIQGDFSGVPDGTAINAASSLLPCSTLTTSPATYRLALDDGVPLTASTTYWLVVERTGARDTSNFPNIRVKVTTDPYAGGSLKSRNSGSWSASSGDDAYFNILGGGTWLYLTNTASDVVTAALDKEAWTSRGGSAVTVFTTSITGWAAPQHATDTNVAGTVIDWYTKQLQAFTLSGLVKVNVRAHTNNSLANSSVGVEIARVDSDGTNASVWGYANRDAAATEGGAGEISSATETAYTIYVSGDDLAFTDGQRVRIRVFFDDCADVPQGNSGTRRVTYNGPTGGASGDTFLILPQTVAEFVSATPVAFPFQRHDPSRSSKDLDPWSVTGWQ